jgi:hypothetical protein
MLMLCPVCKVELRISDRQGVEIDYCPQCRGVWLDRGELDKLIERSTQVDVRRSAEQPARRPDQPVYRHDDDDDDYKYRGDDDYKYRNDPHYQQKKKRGFLGEIFDIFD